MPTYTYRCRSCGHERDLDTYYNDAELSLGDLRCGHSDERYEICEEVQVCEGFMRRVWNIGGISFKGSGFYRNDSRPKPKPEKPATKPAKEKP